MIPRYTRPKMGAIWEEKNKYSTWLAVEIAACEAQAELGVVPSEAVAEIRAKSAFDVERIKEIEAEVHHDVIAFLTNVGEYVGPNSKYIHYGMTSSDVVDTALSLRIKESLALIFAGAAQLTELLKEKALKYKYTYMVGRTHGIHAEPTTFGLKILLWYFEMKRNLVRLDQLKDVIAVGKISGAVGNYANIDSRVEAKVCQKLGLKPAEVSTQVLQRDRHAQFVNTLAILGSSLEKFATEIRSLQRTDILEAEEPFAKGQKGSSAMPHKRNPIISERVSGLARVLRGNALAALEDIALWHERDISHSSVERIIIPDSAILIDYMLAKFFAVMDGLVVHADNMITNINATKGLVFSQRVLLALIAKGAMREDAYKLVQRNAMLTWDKGGNFKDNLLNDNEVSRYLKPEEVAACFNLEYYQKNVDLIFQRM